MPELGHFSYMAEWFGDIQGAEVVTWQEMRAYMACIEIGVTTWHYKTLRTMSIEYVRHLNKRDLDEPQPSLPSSAAPNLANKLKRLADRSNSK